MSGHTPAALNSRCRRRMAGPPFVDEGHSVMDRRTFIGVVATNLIAVPLSAMAQHAAKVRRIGVLNGQDEPGSGWRQAVLPPLRDLGWIEGQDPIVESRYADAKLELLPTFT